MPSIKHLHRRTLARITAGLGVTAVAAAVAVSAGLTTASASAASAAARRDDSFSFNLVPSPNIAACLPKAGGRVTITPGSVTTS